MSQFHSSYKPRGRRIATLLATLFLLLPLTVPLMATELPDTADDGEIDNDSMPVWNGGAAESYAGAGTQGDPFLIRSGEELALLAQQVRAGDSFAGKYFRLTEDILLNDTGDYASWGSQAPARRWIPIGGYATVHVGTQEDFDRLNAEGGLSVRGEEGYRPAENYQSGVIYYRLTAFSGILDGDGHTISGLYTAEGSDYLGLFGICNNATLRNLSLTRLYIEGGDRVGGLCGTLLAGGNLTVDNCKVEGQIMGHTSVGGIAGFARADQGGKLTLSASAFQGKVAGETAVGGILGESAKATGLLQITSCQNKGAVDAASMAGGIAGRLAGDGDLLSHCKNNGPVTADEYTGGIAGLALPGDGIITVSNSQNGGTLLSPKHLGGILGAVLAEEEYATLELLSCKNVGEIIGETAVGGIVGQAKLTGKDSRVRLSGHKNSAAIRGKTGVGGILGEATVDAGALSIDSSENYGAVTASGDCAGGIVGRGRSADSLQISTCSVRATVTAGNTYSGGIAGALTATAGSVRIQLSSAGGTVRADASAAGIAGSIAGALIAQQKSAVAELVNCLGASNIAAKAAAGGIVGELTAQEGQCTLTASLFCGGIFTGCKISGGIAALAHAQVEGAVAKIADCYYNQNTSARAMYPVGGKGDESCLTTEALTDTDLQNPDKLGGLDFTLWQPPTAEGTYPTLQGVPFVWESFQYTVTRDGAILDAYVGRSDVVVIPDKLGGVVVTTISESAFWQSEVIRVVMPSGVTAIGEAAFAGCTALERVTLSPHLISIGARAFQGCQSLTELRCTGTLSTLQVGAENEPYHNVGSFTHPVDLQIGHSYEDGSIAGKGSTLTVYVGDYYQIEPLVIEGYEADASYLSGICQGEGRLSVIYKLGSYRLVIRYLYPDGSEAIVPYEGIFQFGQQYRVPTPALSGFSADYAVLEGAMPGRDTTLTVYFNEVFAEPVENDVPTAEIVLLILSGLATICCLVYFIYRYRSTAPALADRI